MIKVYSNKFPLGAYKAMTLWPFLFIRKKAVVNGLFNEVDERHEEIHGAQQREMLCAGAVTAFVMAVFGFGWWSLIALPIFFWWYGIEWLVRLIQYRNSKAAYKNISFEREAYGHQREIDYLSTRKVFEWIEYI